MVIPFSDKIEQGRRDKVIDNRVKIENFLGSQECQVNTKKD